MLRSPNPDNTILPSPRTQHPPTQPSLSMRSTPCIPIPMILILSMSDSGKQTYGLPGGHLILSMPGSIAEQQSASTSQHLTSRVQHAVHLPPPPRPTPTLPASSSPIAISMHALSHARA